ncbi:MAG TPA: GNAT family N-acetyltransferase [Candidatus Elarobacter sp.]|nr:GNAT family N-acetyltransferase [Candidatus Elarobacter sp.]
MTGGRSAHPIRLQIVAPEDYVRDVLPHSHTLWAGTRTFERYAGEFRATANSAWGKRRFRTVGLHVDGELVASCKRYERVLRCGERGYKAAGIGAVFTPEPLRGRGYATALLGALLDAERDAGTDLAYLFSDIHPAFYERLGFVALPSRTITLRADALSAQRIEVAALADTDAASVRRVFGALDARRPFAFARTALDWEWQRLRSASLEHGAPLVRLGVRRGRALAAYVTGRRIPAADAFVVDELAFARVDDAPLIAPLLRAGAGDLRTVRGWLPPAIARDALPRGAVRARKDAIAMLVPLSAPFRAAFRAHATDPREHADPCWSTDHI